MTPQTLFLFLLCSVIWGSTWIVIIYQLGLGSPLALIFYRFAWATILFFVYDRVFLQPKKNIQTPLNWKHHRLFVLQGFFNFSLNYILTYTASRYLNSGMMALSFTLIIHFNLIGMFLLYKQPFTPKNIFGAIMSFAGMGFLFHNDLFSTTWNQETIGSLAIAVAATLAASSGNMVFNKIKRFEIPVITSNKWGMFYGTLLTGSMALILGHSFAVQTTFNFYWSLAYLTIFGTVIAFSAYMTLIKRLGAEKAAYTSVLSPLIAITFSYFLENFKFDQWMIVGAILCISGNIIALYPKQRAVI